MPIDGQPRLTHKLDFSLLPQNPAQLANLCGENDGNIRLVADRLGIEVYNRGYDFRLVGDAGLLDSAKTILINLYQQAQHNLSTDAVHLQIIENLPRPASSIENVISEQQGSTAAVCHDDGDAGDKPAAREGTDYLLLHTPKKTIRTRGAAQRRFVTQIGQKNITFGVGPAGTGKTYLAVAAAVEALTSRQYERLIITRPAVEAGEKLGFLPGDFSQKVDPYLRPVFDALYATLGLELVDSLITKGVVEVAPLAFMRGRSFNHAFVLLDEGQNTTIEQMKMLLTRMGFGSQVVVTGDPSQVDLPESTTSGLKHALAILGDVPMVQTTRFSTADIVRHPLVQSVVKAYARNQ